MNGTNTVATKTKHYKELIKKNKKRKRHETNFSDRYRNEHENTKNSFRNTVKPEGTKEKKQRN